MRKILILVIQLWKLFQFECLPFYVNCGPQSRRVPIISDIKQPIACCISYDRKKEIYPFRLFLLPLSGPFGVSWGCGPVSGHSISIHNLDDRSCKIRTPVATSHYYVFLYLIQMNVRRLACWLEMAVFAGEETTRTDRFRERFKHNCYLTRETVAKKNSKDTCIFVPPDITTKLVFFTHLRCSILWAHQN